MSLYPFNTNLAREAQSDVPTVRTNLMSVVRRALGSPTVDDPDFLVAAATAMKVGAYTLLHTTLDVPRNVTVTQAIVAAGADTMGTIDIVGTDIDGQSLLETITPVGDSLVAGTKAFKTIVSITGVGWVIAGGNDTLQIGVGGLIGLPDKAPANTVLLATLNGVREATAPTVTFSDTVLALNTVDFNTAWGGTAAVVYYIA